MKKSYTIILIMTTIAGGCMKKEFLEESPSSSMTTIKTLVHCQYLLNNENAFRETPVAGEISSDNYYITAGLWDNLESKDQNTYVWAKHVFDGATDIPDYNIPYLQVNICNEVLAALLRITISNEEIIQKNHIEGTALFLRSYAFHNLLQLFARPFESGTARQDTGIALPLKPDYNAVYFRASMEECYRQIIEDLVKAKTLLPEKVDTANKTKPTKPAVDGLLARVYLSMRDYGNAEAYSDSCLAKQNILLDYNLISLLSRPVFPKNNIEILYYSWMISDNHFFRFNKMGKECLISPELYDIYDDNDLRKTLFYNTNGVTPPILNLSYSSGIPAFSGIAIDEILLIRSECRARNGNVKGAIDDLNSLMKKRYKTGAFDSYPVLSPQATLQLVLNERRKELAFRGLRWSDLRRLNKEGANLTLQRHINNTVYELPPGDLRYTLSIPDDAIAGSRIVQNPR